MEQDKTFVNVNDQNNTGVYNHYAQQIAELRNEYELAGDPQKVKEFASANSDNAKEYMDLINQLYQIRTNPKIVVAYNPSSDQMQWMNSDDIAKFEAAHPDTKISQFNSTREAASALANQFGKDNPDPMPKLMRYATAVTFPRVGEAGGFLGKYPDDELMAKHPFKKSDVIADLAETGGAALSMPFMGNTNAIKRATGVALPVLASRTGGRLYDAMMDTPEKYRTPAKQIAAETGTAFAGGLLGDLMRASPRFIERKKMIFLPVSRAHNGENLAQLGITSYKQVPNEILKATDAGVAPERYAQQAYDNLPSDMELQYTRLLPIRKDGIGTILKRDPKTKLDKGDVAAFMTQVGDRSSKPLQEEYGALMHDLLDPQSDVSAKFMPRKDLGQTGKTTPKQYAEDIATYESKGGPSFRAQFMRDHVKATNPEQQAAFEAANKEYQTRKNWAPGIQQGKTVQYMKQLPISNKRRNNIPEKDSDSHLKNLRRNAGEALGTAIDIGSSTIPHYTDLPYDAKEIIKELKNLTSSDKTKVSK